MGWVDDFLRLKEADRRKEGRKEEGAALGKEREERGEDGKKLCPAAAAFCTAALPSELRDGRTMDTMDEGEEGREDGGGEKYDSYLGKKEGREEGRKRRQVAIGRERGETIDAESR